MILPLGEEVARPPGQAHPVGDDVLVESPGRSWHGIKKSVSLNVTGVGDQTILSLEMQNIVFR